MQCIHCRGATFPDFFLVPPPWRCCPLRNQLRMITVLFCRMHPSVHTPQNAAIAVQVHVRRLIASKRVRGVRHTRRAQAQACIALAVRQRAARVRQKEREQREEQKERERTGGGDQDIAYYLEITTMRTVSATDATRRKFKNDTAFQQPTN